MSDLHWPSASGETAILLWLVFLVLLSMRFTLTGIAESLHRIASSLERREQSHSDTSLRNYNIENENLR